MKAKILWLIIFGLFVRFSISLNDKTAGSIKDLRIDGTPNRSGNSGLWSEREIVLEKSLFQSGQRNYV